MKHLDKKYFRYRADIVAASQARYPKRARILFVSELLRLGFIFLAAALCFVISLIVTWGAAERVGWLDWRFWSFFWVDFLSGWIALRTAQGLLSARRN